MHRRIGILGGLSPESTVTYYHYITREYYRRLGDYGHPEIIIYSVNFQEFVDWQKQGEWKTAAEKMIEVMISLRKAGADFGLIASNTMHIVFDEVQRRIRQDCRRPKRQRSSRGSSLLHRDTPFNK